MNTGGFPPIEKLIPHRGPMRLVDELIEHDGKSAVVKATIRSHSAGIHNGKMESHWAIEIIAQAIAALFGYNWLSAGHETSYGYIIAVDDFSLLSDSDPTVGETLYCYVKLDYEAFPMGVYLGEIHINKNIWAKAKLKCFLNENPEGNLP
jgi:predicted hotdog family 3-hydroxylacyl-ACP dehydratase